tara:strand:- start:390 stop:638 length:249 start_codon:yes stop_codon:yes gene_type:complete
MVTDKLNEVLKWVFIVFVAGFIGYFGRYLSKLVIKYFGKNKSSEVKTEVHHHYESGEKEKYKAKIEKKKLKLEKKRLKKGKK